MTRAGQMSAPDEHEKQVLDVVSLESYAHVVVACFLLTRILVWPCLEVDTTVVLPNLA